MENDREIDFMVILFLLLIQEGLLSVTSESTCTEYWITAWSKLALEKRVVRLTDRLDMTIAVDWDIKQQTKQRKEKGEKPDQQTEVF